ncbi:MAG: hypothetical protein WCP77_11675 [Roseococcus sp.]
MVLNRGASLRLAEPGVGRGVLLTGNPRGGTTFIASVAHHLGIPLGQSRPRYEDRRLRKLLLGEEPDEDRVKLAETIRAREAAHDLWGWKLPGIVQHFDLVDSLVRRPLYVMVFKDPLSMSMRRVKRGDARLVGGLQASVLYTQRMVSFLASTQRECLLVSFEKAIRKQGDLIRTLAELTGIPVTLERVAEIEAAVRADSLLYDREKPGGPSAEEQAAARAARRRRERRARARAQAPTTEPAELAL